MLVFPPQTSWQQYFVEFNFVVNVDYVLMRWVDNALGQTEETAQLG